MHGAPSSTRSRRTQCGRRSRIRATIDEHLVNAQQARRILDRLVGYKISPLLWRRVQKHTSAGRVQSVAVRMICDREEIIQNFVPEEYWTLTAQLSKQKDRKLFPAELVRRLDQSEKEKLRIGSEAEMNEMLAGLADASYTVTKVDRKKTKSMPAAPYSTSSLQQDSSTRLRFSPKKTMKVAQELYEGIDLGEGRTGLITYMRTDSTRISDEAQKSVKGYIGETFGSKYLGPGPKSKQKANVQGAHEAIRPTDVNRLAGSAARDPVGRSAQVVYADLETVRGEFHGAGACSTRCVSRSRPGSTCSRRPVPRSPSRVFTRSGRQRRQRHDAARSCRGREP